MINDNYLISSISIIVLIYSRVLVPILLPPFHGGDVKFHLLFIKTIKENNNRIPYFGKDNYIFKCYFRYPYLYHWLLSFLPEERLLLFSKISGLIIDLIYCSLIYFASIWFFPSANSFLPILVFVSIPQLVFLDNRAHSLSPRPLGELFLSISLISYSLFYFNNNMIFIFIAIISGGFILLTSKGAAQGFVLFNLFITIYILDFYPLVIIIISFIVAFSISNGKYLYLLISHIKHLHFFLKSDSKNVVNITKSLIPKIPNINEMIIDKNKLLSFLQDLANNQILLVTYQNPYFLISLFYISSFEKIPILAWFYAGVFFYIITSFYPFKVFGGPDRYIEYIALPISLIISQSLLVSQISILLVIVIVIITLNFLYLLLGREKAWDNYLFKEQLIDRLKSIPISNILVIPHKPLGIEIGYRTNHKVLTWSSIHIDDVEYTYEKMKYLFPNRWGQLREDISELVEKYNITYTIITEKMVEKYKLENSETLMKVGNYVVIRNTKL